MKVGRLVTFVLFVLVLAVSAGPSLAISGVGSLVTQTGGNVSVFVSGRHAPGAEIVVVDGNDEVVAAGIDTGSGSFSLSFRINSSQLSGAEVLAVDQADETARIDLPASGLSNELMPPSIVFDPEVEPSEELVSIGGYTYPGAGVEVTLRDDNGVFQIENVVAVGDGGWVHLYEDLPLGSYRVTAVSEFGSSVSQVSKELLFVITDDTVIDQATEIGESVGDVIENVADIVLPKVVEDFAKNLAPEAEVVTAVVVPVASASLLTQLLLVGRDLLYWILQGGISLLQYFGFWKKRNPWGLVYDSVTKQPVMLATVRLFAVGKVKKLVETDVTTKTGVFSFFPKAGQYLIQITKPGYYFPSRLVGGKSDGEYDHVYHGEVVHFAADKAPVEVTVPIDPEEVNLSSWFKVKTFVRTHIYVFTMASLAVGLLMSLVAAIGGSASAFNGLLVLFYAGVLGFQFYLVYKRSKSWGYVVDAKGDGVVGVQLDLFDPVFQKLVSRRVSDKNGRYQFVVPEGKYVIRVGSVNHELVKTGKKKEYQGQEIVVVGDKPKLIALRMVVDVRG